MTQSQISQENIEKFNNLLSKNNMPPYFKIFAFQKKFSSMPIFMRALLVGPFLYILFYGIGYAVEGNITPEAQLTMAIVCGAVSSFLVLTTNAYQKSISTISSIATMLVNESQLKQLKKDLYTILIRPTQTWFSLCWAVSITIIIISMGLDLPLSISIIIYIFTFIALFAGGFLLWLSGAAFIWSIKFSNNGPYHLNHCPNKTIGIRKLSRLIGTYSLSFSLSVFVGAMFFYTAPWLDKQLVEYVSIFIVYPFFIFAVAFMIIPQLSIRRIIVEEKERLLAYLERRLLAHGILESNFSTTKYGGFKFEVQLL